MVMAFNKKAEFSKKDQKAAEVAKVLSHPARIAILKTIAKRGVCVCGEIVAILPLAQSTISNHLKELLDAGLISGELDGLNCCYCINWAAIKKSHKAILDVFLELENREGMDCCK